MTQYYIFTHFTWQIPVVCMNTKIPYCWHFLGGRWGFVMKITNAHFFCWLEADTEFMLVIVKTWMGVHWLLLLTRDTMFNVWLQLTLKHFIYNKHRTIPLQAEGSQFCKHSFAIMYAVYIFTFTYCFGQFKLELNWARFCIAKLAESRKEDRNWGGGLACFQIGYLFVYTHSVFFFPDRRRRPPIAIVGRRSLENVLTVCWLPHPQDSWVSCHTALVCGL